MVFTVLTSLSVPATRELFSYQFSSLRLSEGLESNEKFQWSLLVVSQWITLPLNCWILSKSFGFKMQKLAKCFRLRWILFRKVLGQHILNG